jgi:hypothetical protein
LQNAPYCAIAGIEMHGLRLNRVATFLSEQAILVGRIGAAAQERVDATEKYFCVN